MMIDVTAELFKGELGTIHQIENDYTLKEIDEYRSIRTERKKAEAEEEDKKRKSAERQRQAEESRLSRKRH